MELTEEERSIALSTLNSRGFIGSDAETGLSMLCRLSASEDLWSWFSEHQGSTWQSLISQYGHYPAPHAWVLINHLPAKH